MAKEEKQKKKMPKLARNTILVSILAGVSILIYYFFTANNISGDVKIMTLPLVETTVSSTVDGQDHIVKTNISYSMSKESAKLYDEQIAMNVTESTLKGLDYERLKSPEGTEYLKNELKNTIAIEYPNMVTEDFEIYISGYDLGIIKGYLPGLIVQDNSKSTKLSEMFGSN